MDYGFLDFHDAWHQLKKGLKVKRYHWKGYWAWEHGTIMMHCENGEILDIRHTDNVEYTMENLMAEDWIVLPEEGDEE